jgi:hypothetical protein
MRHFRLNSIKELHEVIGPIIISILIGCNFLKLLNYRCLSTGWGGLPNLISKHYLFSWSGIHFRHVMVV